MDPIRITDDGIIIVGEYACGSIDDYKSLNEDFDLAFIIKQIVMNLNEGLESEYDIKLKGI